MKTRDMRFRVWTGKKMLDWKYWCANAITVDEFFNVNSNIMAWTGFYDKAGTEIYDGDIVRVKFDEKMILINLLVKWENVGWEPFNSYSDILRDGYKPEQHLVIGNIYENPDIEYRKTGDEK